MNHRRSLPQQLIELMVADSNLRHGIPVNTAPSCAGTVPRFIRALGPDYSERIISVVSEAADLAFSRMHSPKTMPPAEAAKVREMMSSDLVVLCSHYLGEGSDTEGITASLD